MSRHSTASLRARTGRAAIMMANMVRRVAVTAAKAVGGQWGYLGYDTGELDGVPEGEDIDDDDQVEVFQGLYVYAKPGASDNSEAILLQVGGEPEHPTMTALRNEDARRRYVEEYGDISSGEMAIFSSTGKTRVFINAANEIELEVEPGGKIYARSNGGSAEALLKRSEFESFRTTIFDLHTHVYLPGPGSATPTATPLPVSISTTGTTVLEGE